MPRIRVLSRSVAEKIAAGEVVERPASVVKELVENALDAEATHLRIELEEGGKKLIRIRDDGSGMDAEDVKLAFVSHATSKLESAEDLDAITSMGFRGEALTSIAAISHVRLTSTPQGEPAGAVIEVSGGVIGEPRPIGAPEGTTVEVRNLFYNVPARRKFLKSVATEVGHASEVVTKISLAHPNIHFELWHNRRKLFSLPAITDLKERIAALYGRELASDIIPVREVDDYLQLQGYLGSPRHTRSNTRTQFVYINCRFIRDRLILHALREAYRGLVESGRFPIAFLFLKLDPRQVDVNVHPMKLQVRFRDSARVFGIIAPALKDALRQKLPGVPGLPSKQETDEHRQRLKQALADFFQAQASSRQPSLPIPRLANRGQEPKSEVVPRMGTRFFQVHRTYIVEETPEGLTIIDQHALHERVIYENLKRSLRAGKPTSQKLLVPLSLELDKKEELLLGEYKEAFARIGFEIKPEARGRVAVLSAPQLLRRLDPARFIRDLLDEIGAESLHVPLEEKLEALCSLFACKSAVKAGQALGQAEMEGLLSQREKVPQSDSCPHGRPTALKFSLAELEEYFHRH